ncbi:MAG TPA: DNA translocase FtsK 4TM domain-containing protein [Candidatus Limnocylindrales bacterium]|nr:DNA translocase FtsK 4TM domain-containing protein [Candidatus Limnocylindrales bacterium]
MPVRRKYQILGLCLVSVALFLAVALVTRDARDTASDLLSTGSVRNQGGVVGAFVATGVVAALGMIGAWLLPLALLLWGWNRLRLRPAGELWLRTAVGAAGCAAAMGLLYLLSGGNRGLVGKTGEGIGIAATRLLGRVGSELVLGTALVVIALVAFELGASSPLRRAAAALLARLLPGPSPRRRAPDPDALGAGAERSGALTGGAGALGRRGRKTPIEQEEEALASAFAPRDEPGARRESKPRIVARQGGERAESMTIPFPPAAPRADRGERDEKRRGAGAAGGLPAFAGGGGGAGGAGAPEAGLSLGPALAPDAALPPIDLLDRHEAAHQAIEESELFELSRVLERTLADFDVAGKVSEVHPGPVITLFEYEPAPGVKVNQILQRQDDLALSLKAQRIRIVAPIPGKAAVGIEIPNRRKALVSFREIVASKYFQETTQGLPFALGKDVAGEPFTTSLEKMPHVLIAGATGSGKSVCINTLIMSLLMKRTPAELRFIMIDPKMLELTPYNGIPHLRMPVVTDPKKAAQALRYCVKEMERRYQTLAKHGARNIEAYNRLGLDPAEHEDPRLPYLVVVVDELADLMALLPTEIEEPIGRLAQMARAVGIHLILATQRPSVDVITGVIKANFPSRIAFQVASRTDSRVILDMNGAESLLGNGDSLFLPAGKPEPYRIHGSYVSGEEIERVVGFLKEQGGPVVADDSALEQVRALDESESDDELLEEAMRIVVLHRQASTSMLQRRLKVGYSRAARLLDDLEARGVVGPSEGAKGREVLVTEHELAERRSQAALGTEDEL